MKKLSLLLLGFLVTASPAFAALTVSPNPYTGEAAAWSFLGETADNVGLYDDSGTWVQGFGVGAPFGPSGANTFDTMFGGGEPSDGDYTIVAYNSDACGSGIDLATCELDVDFVASAAWVVGEEEEALGPLGSFGAASVAASLTDSYSDLGGTMTVVIAAVVLGIVALLGLGFGVRYLRKYITGRKF